MNQYVDIYFIHYNEITEPEFLITGINHRIVHFRKDIRSSAVQPPAQSMVNLRLDQLVQVFIQFCSENLQGQTEPAQHLWAAWSTANSSPQLSFICKPNKSELHYLFQVTDEDINRTSPRLDTCDTPLVTNLHVENESLTTSRPSIRFLATHP